MPRFTDRDMTRLLAASDPDPVAWFNPGGASNIFLTCEHAGRAVPAALGDLGITPEEMDRHIAYDVGAEGVARALAGRLDAARTWEVDPGSAAYAESLGAVERDVQALVDAVRATSARVVLVSNEVGSGVVPEHASGRLYRDLLGALNARVAAECDEVHLVVAGRVLAL